MSIKRSFRKFKLFLSNYKIVIIVILLGLTLFIGYPTFAKYISSFAGVGSASVDKIYYSVDLVNTSATVTSKTITYYFNVNNYDSAGTLNEVLAKYYMKVQWPLADINPIDCASKATTCEVPANKDQMKKDCPVTCGYADSLGGVTFTKKVYYNDPGTGWIEIPANTSGIYVGYYTGYENLNFATPTVHEYKIVIELSDDVYVADEYDLYINLEVVQTQS